MDAFFGGESWLPVAFVGLMGVSILLYVILDGYDLGVGILSGLTNQHKDKMIASIGPFWDANETWLVLAVGLLLVAFPFAQGVILGALYLPVAVMLLGLILRGVAFDFRAKVAPEQKIWWDRAFFGGSLLTALSQGYMLGLYILGFERTLANVAFAGLVAVGLAAAYAFIGAGWLILKSEGALQKRAVGWAKVSLWLSAVGLAAVSIATPLVSERIFEKWFAMPYLVMLAPIPLITAALILALHFVLKALPNRTDSLSWAPFSGAIAVVLLAFYGLAYSFYPYVVPERMTVWEAAAADESLFIMFIGACIVLPLIALYTSFIYRIFSGKTQDLRYY